MNQAIDEAAAMTSSPKNVAPFLEAFIGRERQRERCSRREGRDQGGHDDRRAASLELAEHLGKQPGGEPQGASPKPLF